MKAILAILTLLSLQTAYAAGSDDYIPKSPTEGLSPTAKSFQRYGDIPVSLYTGTPSVAVPLTVLKSGNLTLPIEISYHSGGVKADEHPGWTGLGWSLTAGGAITREVRDLPDETRQYGYKYTCKDLHLNQINSQQVNNFVNNLNGTPLSPAGDSEPDKFSFQFFGYSGYFMMDADGKGKIFCDRPLKIEADEPKVPYITFNNGVTVSSTQQPAYHRFIITGDDGTKYTFGQNAIDMTINSASQTDSDWETSAWYLTEVIHPNGDKINFKYERGDFVVNFFRGFSGYRVDDKYRVINSGAGGRLISPVYLSEITGSTFKVVLSSSQSRELNFSGQEYLERSTPVNSSPSVTRPIYCPVGGGSMMSEVKWRKLDNITVFDNSGKQVKKVEFSYTNSDYQRLMLLSLKIKERSNKNAECYQFSYSNVSGLPSYLSTNVDHWGYIGSLSNNPDSPNYKESSPPYNPPGLLKEITYPLGGKTVLEFEPNTYTFVNNGTNYDSERTCGGYRIKRIVNIPNNGSLPEVKDYRYYNGILEGIPTHSATNQYIDKNGNVFNITETSSNSLSSIVNNYGYHICYPMVEELKADSSRTVTEFFSPTDVDFRDQSPIFASDPTALVHSSLKGQYRGRTKSITFYSAKGRPVKSIQKTYSPLGGTMTAVNGLYCDWFTIPNIENSHATPLLFPKYSLYSNYTYTLVETGHEESDYNASGTKYRHSSTYKTYNSAGQISRDSTVVTYSDSRHETAVKHFYYKWEKDSWYQTNNIRNLLARVEQYHNGKNLGNIVFDYNLQRGIFPVLTNIKESFIDGDYRDVYQCGLSDKTGLPVHVIDASGLHTVYLWGPDRIHPIVEIKNTDAQSVRAILGYDPADAPDDSYLPAKIPLLRQGLPNAMITIYTYEPFLGVTSITDPAGKTTRFEYDEHSRLTKIFDLNNNVITRFKYSTYSEDKNEGLATIEAEQ